MNTKRKVDGKGFPIKEKEKRDLCVSKEKQTNLGLLRGVCFWKGVQGHSFRSANRVLICISGVA